MNLTHKRLSLTTMLAALIVLAWAAPASATFQGSLGKLAYWKDEPLNAGAEQHKIFLDDPSDDQPPQQLTAGYAPAWSPDGTKLAFEINDRAATDTHFTEGIAVINADGTGRQQLVITPEREPSPFTAYRDHYPAFSADGNSIYYLRGRGRSVNASGDQDHVQLRKVTLGGSDSLIKTYDIQSTGLRGLAASPDGTKLISVHAVNSASGFEANAVLLDAATGTMTTIPGTSGASAVDFAPDSKRVVVTTAIGGAGITSKVIRLSDNHVLQSFPGLGSTNSRFSPDGSNLLTQETCGTGVGATCTLVSHLLDDPDADIPDYVPREKVLGTVHRREVDVQPQTQPIIFVHGFAGSFLACSNDELWPPTPFSGEDLLDMRLAEDGVSRHPDACDAQPTGIIDSAYGTTPIYETALDYLNEVRPDDHHVYVWDWRKDPRTQMLGLNTMVNDALQGELQKKQGVTKVVLMAHSMGGLVVRKYIDDPGFAKKVSRVVTIGTPYWGSPKALLPLALGITAPGGADPLDHLLADSALREMFRNLTGGYFLYPSEKFGPWLSVDGRTPSPMDRAALLDYVGGTLGGNANLLAKALDAHKNELDGFKLNGVDYRAYVGTGFSTIGRIRLIPGGDEDQLEIGWVNGDVTVPGRSGSQGPIGTTDPFGEDVPISYVCNVQHVPLPGDPKVTTPIKDFLLYGTQPRRTEDVCLNESKEIRFKDVDLPEDPAPSAARLMDAGTAGVAGNPGLQLFRVPGEPIAVTDNDFPVDLTAQGDGARLAVTPLSGETRGAPVYYGPINGELTLKSGPGGSLAVLDDGAPVMPRTSAEAGDPVVPSDPGGGPGPGPDPDPGPGDGGAGGGPGPGGDTGNPPPDTNTPLPDTDAPETTIRKKPKRSVTTKAKWAMARFHSPPTNPA